MTAAADGCSRVHSQVILERFDGFTVVHFETAFREALNKQSAVGFCEQSGVEYDDASGVVAMSNESPEALFELDDGFGCLVVAEGISTAAADELKSGFEEWVIGDAEGQFGDDHVLQSVSGDVDALPEAVGSEQHSAGVVAEAFEHGGAGESGALAVE